MQNRHAFVAAIASASLLATFSAYAAKGAVYQAPPQEPEYSRFMLTGGATYLLPTMNGLDYAEQILVTGDVDEFNPVQIQRSYNWGYFLAAGYMINERYDAQVSWAQSDASNNSSIPACTGVCETITPNTFIDAGEAVSTHESLNYQVFDGTVGQYHQLGDHLMTRVFAGVRYAKITNNTTNDYFFEGTLDFADYYDSSFSGWGPELGFDVNYMIYDWVSIIGHFTGAALIGELSSNSSFQLEEGAGAVDSAIEAQIVPAFDAKLGLNFSIPFLDYENRFVIEAGYQIDYYFDVVNQISTVNEGTLGVTDNLTNVGLMGPYANVSVMF